MDRISDQELTNPRSYTISGKIMLAAIILLFFVLILMLFLHLYARCYITRARRRNFRRRIRRRTRLVFYTSPVPPAGAAASFSAVDPTVLKSLPVFTYSADEDDDVLECAVCLSEFEKNETGRLLPKCKHCFHTDCIDMWFLSHSTCPLCRSPVEPGAKPDENKPVRVDDDSNRPEPSSSSTSPSEDTASFESETKQLAAVVDVSVEVPSENAESVRDEWCDAETRSPASRMLSLPRILSRRAANAGDADVEGGRETSQQENSGLTRAECHVEGCSVGE